MKLINFTKMHVFLVTLVIALLTQPYLTVAQVITVSDEITTDQSFISVKGKISWISLESMFMIVKPNKDKRIKVQLTGETEFVNFYSYKELEESNRVKVWYQTDGEVNKTVKIEKYQELGC